MRNMNAEASFSEHSRIIAKLFCLLVSEWEQGMHQPIRLVPDPFIALMGRNGINYTKWGL